MAHSHFNTRHDATGPQSMIDPDELRRHRRAMRILVVVLTPLAIWTVVGLIALWPGDISDQVNTDVAGYSVVGVTYPKARITDLTEISCDGLVGSSPGGSERCANATTSLLDGDDRGQAVTVSLTAAVYSSGVDVGQVVRLVRVPPSEGQPASYQFSDFERRTPLIVFSLIFAAVVIGVARWRGFASLIGLGFAGFILVKFMFPALVAGTNPILVGLIGSSAIMFVVLYAAHGFSARTTTALIGTLFGLITIAILGYIATRWAHLTGVSSEEDFVLAAAAPNMSLTSVVLCGIIVAGLGVLNDVTITQASAIWELADADSRSPMRGRQKHLFTRAMRIGRDHIASTVYTIAFATAGASLGVLLLIAIYDRPLLQVLQTEQFAGEIIRTLVGSIGLVLAVPLTTAIGAAVVRVSGSAAPAPRPARPSVQQRPTSSPADATTETTVLPRTRWRELEAAAAREAEAKSAQNEKPRRTRRRKDDDFGDFGHLREPGDTDPGPRTDPGSRRSR